MIINIDVALWGLLIGTLLPIIVALITARFADSWLKTVVLLALSAIVAIGNEIVVAGSFEVKPTILKFALLFLTGVGAHYGLLKPTRVTGTHGVVAQSVPAGLHT